MDHIARKEDIGQAVVVDIADGYAPAIVEIDIVEDVEGFAVKKRVLEVDTGLVFIQVGKELGVVAGPTAGSQEGHKAHKREAPQGGGGRRRKGNGGENA